MKKTKLFLVVLLSWLSLSSVVPINASAVRWPVKENSFTLMPNTIGKFSIKDNDDFNVIFTINITSLSDSPANVTMILFKMILWINHSNEIDYLYDHSVITPIENLTDTPNVEDFYVIEHMFYEDDRFYPGFINMATFSWVNIDVTVEREEIGRVAYYFAGFVTVIFAGIIFFVLKKRRDLLGVCAEEVPREIPLDSE